MSFDFFSALSRWQQICSADWDQCYSVALFRARSCTILCARWRTSIDPFMWNNYEQWTWCRGHLHLHTKFWALKPWWLRGMHLHQVAIWLLEPGTKLGIKKEPQGDESWWQQLQVCASSRISMALLHCLSSSRDKIASRYVAISWATEWQLQVVPKGSNVTFWVQKLEPRHCLQTGGLAREVKSEGLITTNWLILLKFLDFN